MFRTPVATYRIQFSREFRFTDAYELVPYLHQLGITDLYSSPRFQPLRGSSHGYDVTSPDRVNPALGSEAEFDDLSERLRNYDLGLLLDIVPNHMAASYENEWWADVLEHGPASTYADYFDIDWHPQITKATFLQNGRVLVPVLGDMYGDVLQSGQLSLGLEDSGFYLTYYERRFPIDPGTYSPLLETCAAVAAAEGLGETEASLRELGSFSERIPPREGLTAPQASARFEACRELTHRLFLLHRDDHRTRLAVERGLVEFAGQPDRMHGLLERQAYRLAQWRIAAEEINYRRFFDINDLVSLRVELPHVFEARHATIGELVRSGHVTGLRVDHIDGLYEPGDYLDRLQRFLGGSAETPAVYVVVEKVLGAEEALPQGWPAAGTTGYDFLNVVNDLFLDADGLEQIEQSYLEMTGVRQPFSELCYECNRQAMRQLFAGEVERLTVFLSKLAARHWIARDLPASELRAALVEITACLPVYRTYATGEGLTVAERGLLERTLQLAKVRMGSSVNVRAWQFLREVLLLEAPSYDPDLQPEYLAFLRRWQQFTGPVMAKGLEDTAFYRRASLISRNEVGGDPLRETPPFSPQHVHEFFERREKLWPDTLNATSTHDTKRSEDVRARLNVLSEIPQRWNDTLAAWRRRHKALRVPAGGTQIPSPAEETMLYQTLLGVWPLPEEGGAGAASSAEFRERIGQFLRKSLREAKLNSDWLAPEEGYESSVLAFAKALLDAPAQSAFRRSFDKLAQLVAYHGAWNSLSQLVVKITAPGVPDFYQGSELWTFQLVDPDNRRPVDYARRREALQALEHVTPRGRRPLAVRLARHWQDGSIKLFVTDAGLNFRRDHSELFAKGNYIPLPAAGPRSASVFAFARRLDQHWVVTIAPRMTTALTRRQGALGSGAKWEGTKISLPADAPAAWTNLFTGRSIPTVQHGEERALDAGAALDRFPVAILHSSTREDAAA